MSATKRERARGLLAERDIAALIQWSRKGRGLLRTLFSLTFDDNELIRWRSIETIGLVSAPIYEFEPNKIRDYVRRLLWLMNDESGGLGWHAPEVIGEILVNVPDLGNEFAGLLSGYLLEEPFEAGVCFAIYRTAHLNRTPYLESELDLGAFLSHPDPMLRGYALLALGAIGTNNFIPSVKMMRDNPDPLSIYDFTTGLVSQTNVGTVARLQVELLSASASAC
jgi:hypothetical protein